MGPGGEEWAPPCSRLFVWFKLCFALCGSSCVKYLAQCALVCLCVCVGSNMFVCWLKHVCVLAQTCVWLKHSLAQTFVWFKPAPLIIIAQLICNIVEAG